MTMTVNWVINTLRKHNEWRRGGCGIATNPEELGKAIDTAAYLLSINKQDDIETLEQEARQIRARMDRLQRERDELLSALHQLAIQLAHIKNDALLPSLKQAREAIASSIGGA